MVERGKKIHKQEKWLVQHCKPQRSLYVFNGFNMPIVWRKGLVPQHASHVSSYFPYAHDIFEDEIFIEGAQDWEELLHRMANPSMTKFKEMTMDEELETIEHTG
jgi:hypothetical protein